MAPTAHPRREAGQGAITFDTSVGLFTGRLDLGRNPQGHRVRVKVSGRTRTEVRNKLDKARRDREHGADLTARPTTFADLANLWLTRGLPTETSDNTRENYTTLIRSRLLPALGPLKVVAIKPDDIEDLLDHMATQGLSARTMRLTLNLARRILEFARTREIIVRNVADLVHAPRGPHNNRTGLSVEQARALLGAMDGERLGPLFTVSLLLGLRPGEAAALRWTDLDLDATPPTLRIESSLRRTPTGNGPGPTQDPHQPAHPRPVPPRHGRPAHPGRHPGHRAGHNSWVGKPARAGLHQPDRRTTRPVQRPARPGPHRTHRRHPRPAPPRPAPRHRLPALWSGGLISDWWPIG